MSFIGNAVKSLGQAIGIIPDDPRPAPINTPTTTAPALSNTMTSDVTNAAEQAAAASATRGRTSTMLTGSMGEDETKLNTSKILLGQ